MKSKQGIRFIFFLRKVGLIPTQPITITMKVSTTKDFSSERFFEAHFPN